MENTQIIPETKKIIDFSESAKKKSNFFAIAVHSELMMELVDGEIDPQVVFDILTSQGKSRVRERLCI